MSTHFLITGFGPDSDDLAIEIVDREDLLGLDAVKAILGDDVVADDANLLAGEYELTADQASAVLKPFGHDIVPGVEYFIGRR